MLRNQNHSSDREFTSSRRDESIIPLHPVASTAERSQTRRAQSRLALSVVGLGLVAWTSAITCLALCGVELAAAIFEIQSPVNWQLLSSLWLALVLIATVFCLPYDIRSLGTRLRSYPLKTFRRRMKIRSLADHLKFLRSVVISSVGLSIVVCALDSSIIRVNREVPPLNRELPALIGWAVFMFLGWKLCTHFVPSYRDLHARTLRQSLHAHHRGVALRSFIPEWDNPAREIYRSCRLSARLGRLHRVFTIVSVGCFTAAACWAVTVSTDYFLGEWLGIVSIAVMIFQWPTASRVVDWTGAMIDPFCDDQHEYEEY